MAQEPDAKPAPAEGHTAKHPVKKFLQIIAAPVLVLLVILGFFLVTGLRLCAVQSGSMEPNIPTYSLCLVGTRYDYNSLQVGDIIVYDRPYDHLQVVHRIVAILDEGIITKGDANPVDDGILLTEADITGVYLGHIPGVGRITSLVRTPVGIGIIWAAVVLLLVSSLNGHRLYTANRSSPNRKQVSSLFISQYSAWGAVPTIKPGASAAKQDKTFVP